MREAEKELAANAALNYIRSGMLVGLGSGSTVACFIRQLGAKVAEGSIKNISCVVASHSSEVLAKKAGLPLLSVNDISRIDIGVDGADEFDDHLNLIKGGGGALVREKILASLAGLFIIIADSGKKAEILGSFKLPLEVFVFCSNPVLEKLAKKGYRPSLRKNTSDEIFVTDNGNYIIDLDLKQITDPYQLNEELCGIPGIIDNGLFLNYAGIILMAKAGEIFEFKR
jgi:ribose 5-phosphate isomerase A